MRAIENVHRSWFLTFFILLLKKEKGVGSEVETTHPLPGYMTGKSPSMTWFITCGWYHDFILNPTLPVMLRCSFVPENEVMEYRLHTVWCKFVLFVGSNF